MTDDDFKAAFRRLDPIEPSPRFLRRVRQIPLHHPREETSLWRLFRLPSRLATLAVSAICGLGVGYLTVERGQDLVDAELDAFMNLDTEDSFYAASLSDLDAQ